MEQIGRYKIVGELGRGAMGIVFKAQDPAIGRMIAIKSIRLNDLTDESERDRLRERLFREAQSAGMLSHPGIVTIYDIAEENGMAYIFMELVNGPPLEKMLKAEQTPDKETLLSLLRQTAAALDYAHKKGIVHRDIKPANIMVHEDGTAKVTDFGVAKIVSQQMTQAGTIMGTPSYMSPEQVQGAPVSGRSDQFSLAVIAYEILTGDKPFNAEYLPTLLFKIVREDPVPPHRLNPTLMPVVEAVMRKALAKSPDNRYETCLDFVNALAAACNASAHWIPLPRGASNSLPTVGSADRLTATSPPEAMDETVAAPLSEMPARPAARPSTLEIPKPPASGLGATSGDTTAPAAASFSQSFAETVLETPRTTALPAMAPPLAAPARPQTVAPPLAESPSFPELPSFPESPLSTSATPVAPSAPAAIPEVAIPPAEIPPAAIPRADAPADSALREPRAPEIGAAVPAWTPPIHDAPSGHGLRSVLLGLVAGIVVVGGVLFFMRHNPPASQPPDTPAAQNSGSGSDAAPAATPPAPAAATPATPPPSAAATPSAAPSEPASTPASSAAPTQTAQQIPAPAPQQAKSAPAKPTAASAPAPANAEFQLTTTPAGAEAIFDGSADLRCTSPCSLNLPLGRHTIAIRHEGYRESQRVFNLPSEPGLIVTLERLVGTVSLVSNPPGLTIFVDGQEQARKTPASLSLPVGTHRVQIVKGGEKQEFAVEVRDGVLTQRNVDWGN